MDVLKPRLWLEWDIVNESLTQGTMPASATACFIMCVFNKEWFVFCNFEMFQQTTISLWNESNIKQLNSKRIVYYMYGLTGLHDNELW
jgi:hypothetical protein